jgi:hypothetical protein
MDVDTPKMTSAGTGGSGRRPKPNGWTEIGPASVSIAIHHRTCRNLPLNGLDRIATACRMAELSADGHSKDVGLQEFP